MSLKALQKSWYLVYPFGYMLTSGVNFIITIWLTNIFSQSDFGHFSIFKAAVFTLWPFIGMSTHFYIQSQYFKDKTEDLKTRLFSSLLLNFILFISLEIIFYLFYDQLSAFLGLYGSWVFLIPLIALNLCFIRISLILLQLSKRPIQFLVVSISQVLFNIGLIYYFVVVNSYNWEGRGYAYLCATIATSFMGFIMLIIFGMLRPKYSWAFLKESLFFGLSAIMVDICIVSIAFTDQIFIKRMIDTDSLGVYAVAIQLAAVVGVIDSAFTQAIYPRLYKYYAVDDQRSIRRESIVYLIGIALFAAAYVSSAPYLFSNLVGDSFNESIVLLRLLIVALVSLSVYKLVVTKLYYHKGMQKLVVPSILIIGINILSHYYLVPLFGMNGAIYTNILSYSLLAFSVVMIGKYSFNHIQ